MKEKGRGFALCSALPTEALAKVGALRPELPAPAPTFPQQKGGILAKIKF